MPTQISPLSEVHPDAQIADDVTIGPFCRIDADVSIGSGTVLQSHVVVEGHTVIGRDNTIHPHSVIGGPPQDISYSASRTSVMIGDGNIIREGVTINRGAEKEDHVTRIGHRNLLMSNSHVAHNCHVFDNVILVNGVLLGGHVHVHDGAIISGNSVVHHFSTVGTLAFVSGGCRVPHDIPPYMLAAGSDNPTVKTLNLIGLRRKKISEDTIRSLKYAHRLLFRNNRTFDETQQLLLEELDGVLPFEVSQLLNFVAQQRKGKYGRAREQFRDSKSGKPTNDEQRRAA